MRGLLYDLVVNSRWHYQLRRVCRTELVVLVTIEQCELLLRDIKSFKLCFDVIKFPAITCAKFFSYVARQQFEVLECSWIIRMIKDMEF